MKKKLFNFISILRAFRSYRQGSNDLSTRLYFDYKNLDKSPKLHDDLYRTLCKGIDILDLLGVQYSLGRGTMLGLFRDGKFTKGDNDIDIDVFNDYDVYRIIAKMPFDLVFTTISNGRYQQLVFKDPENNVIFDIWFYTRMGANLLNRHDQGIFTLPVNAVSGREMLEYQDRKFSVYKGDWYCRYWYGINWKSPVFYSKDWITFYKEDCEAFNFSPVKDPVYLQCH